MTVSPGWPASRDLLSPRTGERLHPDTAWSLADAEGRWPVVDGIPYLRTDREDLVADALARLDGGAPDEALLVLLGDQDDWWDGPKPDAHALRDLLARRETLTLRDAMERLAFGRVGDYFAHRWSDPTFLAGLALAEAHRPVLGGAPVSAFELACGIGQHLRELQLRGVAVAGGDVVFAKLWLARFWVLDGPADLVCHDASAPWPLPGPFDLVLCQDAFYFLDAKRAIAERLRAAAGERGTVLVGHVHNAEAATFSAGAAVTADDIALMFPDALVYDDAELTAAMRTGRAPISRPVEDLREADAFSLAEGPRLAPPRALDGGLAVPGPERCLRRNPLYGPDGRVAWPSERYRAEYAALATYPDRTALPAEPASWTALQARLREVVDLPERW